MPIQKVLRHTAADNLAIRLQRINVGVTKLSGNPDHPQSRGRLCPKATGAVDLDALDSSVGALQLSAKQASMKSATEAKVELRRNASVSVSREEVSCFGQWLGAWHPRRARARVEPVKVWISRFTLGCV